MLAAAELPIIHAGSGIIHAGAYDELRRVAELLHAPVTTSWAGARRAARDVRAGDPDAVHPAQQRGAQRRRPRAGGGLAPRRDRLVGQGAVLAAPVRAADDPGGHRRPHPRRQQARRAHRAGRREALPRGAGRPARGSYRRDEPRRAAAQGREVPGEGRAERAKLDEKLAGPGRADEPGARRARLPAGVPARARCSWPTAATRPCGP